MHAILTQLVFSHFAGLLNFYLWVYILNHAGLSLHSIGLSFWDVTPNNHTHMFLGEDSSHQSKER